MEPTITSAPVADRSGKRDTASRRGAEPETYESTEEERDYYSLSRRVYSVVAPFYDAVALPLRKLRGTVARLLDLTPASRVLDVATGTGEQAFALARKAGHVVGIDLSESMLHVARRKNRFPNVVFGRADATSLPFEDGSFDASCISFALHEMPLSIRQRVVREMARVTRSGGQVVVVDYALPRGPVMAALVYRLVKLYERDHYASFVRSDLDELLQDAGIRPYDHLSALAGVAKVTIGRKCEVMLAHESRNERRAVASW